MSLFDSGIRPAVDAWLLQKSKEVRNYGSYWSASSAFYCMRKNIFERLGVPHVEKEDDARRQRVFTAGHLFHCWMQKITKEAGLSIAQELELQDEELMIRGHIDDLVLVSGEMDYDPKTDRPSIPKHLILMDYKTRNSRNFDYSKTLSYYHRGQLGTYMYMLRNDRISLMATIDRAAHGIKANIPELTESRILNIEKDTLRMSENQLLWSPELEKEVVDYWTTLNRYWAEEKIPPCTCHVHENGFLAKPKWNPYFYNNEPCSLEYYKEWKNAQAVPKAA